MCEAWPRWRDSLGVILRGSFLTSFYGNGAAKFDGLSEDIPTISNFLKISAKH